MWGFFFFFGNLKEKKKNSVETMCPKAVFTRVVGAGGFIPYRKNGRTNPEIASVSKAPNDIILIILLCQGK